MGGEDCINPDHDDNDSSVCTFMMFVIKDVVEFSGLLPSQVSQPTKQFQVNKHKKQVFAKYLDEIKNAVAN